MKELIIEAAQKLKSHPLAESEESQRPKGFSTTILDKSRYDPEHGGYQLTTSASFLSREGERVTNLSQFFS